jgi:hypothetical protein
MNTSTTSRTVRVTLLATILLSATSVACGQTTPKHHIPYSGIDPNVDVSHVDPAQIDAAAEMVAGILHADVDVLTDKGLIVYFNDGPLYADSVDASTGAVVTEKYHGLTRDYTVSVELPATGCLFAVDSALPHELVHAMLEATTPTHDMDNAHASPAFLAADAAQGALRASVCQ